MKAEGKHPFWALLDLIAHKDNNVPGLVDIPTIEMEECAANDDDDGQTVTEGAAAALPPPGDEIDIGDLSSCSSDDELTCYNCRKLFTSEAILLKHLDYCKV